MLVCISSEWVGVKLENLYKNKLNFPFGKNFCEFFFILFFGCKKISLFICFFAFLDNHQYTFVLILLIYLFNKNSHTKTSQPTNEKKKRSPKLTRTHTEKIATITLSPTFNYYW